MCGVDGGGGGRARGGARGGRGAGGAGEDLSHAGKDLCLGKRKRLAAFLTLSIVVLYPKDFGCGLPFYSQRAVWEPCTDRKGNHVKQNQKKNNKTKQSSHFIIQRLIAYKEK